MSRRQLNSRNKLQSILATPEQPPNQQTQPTPATQDQAPDDTTIPATTEDDEYEAKDKDAEHDAEEEDAEQDTIDPELVAALEKLLQDVETLYEDDTHCPRCGKTWTCKRGKSATGKQRFWCKHCKRSYQEGANIRTKKIKLAEETYHTYLICFLQRRTIREIAEICEISTTRALKIRHIILDALERYNTGNRHWRDHEDVEMFMEKFHGVNPENFQDYLQYYDLIEKH